MRKSIIHKLYFLLLILAPFTCVCVIFQELLNKEVISFVNEIDSEIAEDEGLTDSNEVNFHSTGNGLINSQGHFNFDFSSNSLSNISYLFYIQEIYLGLSTPPPKSFIS